MPLLRRLGGDLEGFGLVDLGDVACLDAEDAVGAVHHRLPVGDADAGDVEALEQIEDAALGGGVETGLLSSRKSARGS